MSDKIQFSELIKRSPKAVQSLYETNFPIVLRFVTLNTGSLDEAREIFHDALFVLLQRIKENQIDESDDLTLHVYSIARILWMDMMRGKRMNEHKILHVHEFLELKPEVIRKRIVGVKTMSARFKTLPEPGRTIVRDHFARGESLSEIALRMGFSSEESAEKNKLKAITTLMESAE